MTTASKVCSLEDDHIKQGVFPVSSEDDHSKQGVFLVSSEGDHSKQGQLFTIAHRFPGVTGVTDRAVI
ncbi:hypothetical protein ACOMHN_054457 [Nucella lapillus]